MSIIGKIINIIKCKGIRYVLFRANYEIKRKSGLLKLSYPTRINLKKCITLNEWRKNTSSFFFDSREKLDFTKNPKYIISENAERILKGDICYFSKTWFNIGNDYDWVTNPENGYGYDSKKHWVEIEDLNLKNGDIKYVWEKSRFCFLYDIIRYDYHYDLDHSKYIFDSISDWIEKNPLNCGPNYKCSQEISIRILNWTFALYFYKNSSYLNEELFQKILKSIYGQVKHIEKNINFSRICVRNNHAITETLTLYLTSLLFPFLPGSIKRKNKGKKWFEQEIDFQIADDGTFIQDSMNYHRVLIQLLTWGIILADINGERFSKYVYEKALSSVNFLFQCQDEKNGWLPNYGANDGALFFPLNSNDYRDYRPQLDALHQLLTGCKLYTEDFEDKQWYLSCINRNHELSPVQKQYGILKFENSGYFLFREKETLSFIRCGSFNNSKYGRADCLHLDVWYKGENILFDGGSYKYNTELELIEYFNGSESHNTVMLGKYGHMKKGLRFMWHNPPIINQVKAEESKENYIFETTIQSFTYLDLKVLINRKIIKIKDAPYWIIEDSIINKPSEFELRQLWHTNSQNINIETNCSKRIVLGKVSDYYGTFIESSQVEVFTNSNYIITNIFIS